MSGSKSTLIAAIRRNSFTPISNIKGQTALNIVSDLLLRTMRSVEHIELDEIYITSAVPIANEYQLSSRLRAHLGLSPTIICQDITSGNLSTMNALSIASNHINDGFSKASLIISYDGLSKTSHWINLREQKDFSQTQKLFDPLKQLQNCPLTNQSAISLSEEIALKSNLTRNDLDQYLHNSLKKTSMTLMKQSESIQPKQDLLFNTSLIDSASNLSSNNNLFTTASWTPLTDGAGAILLISDDLAIKNKISPLAEYIPYISQSIQPEAYTLAPLKLYENSQASFEAFEVNDADPTVPLLFGSFFGKLPINLSGGLPPIGYSPATCIINLIMNALSRYDDKRTLVIDHSLGGLAMSAILNRL